MLHTEERLSSDETQDMARQACIQDCLECYSTCLETVNYCLQQGGKHATPEHINILMDCAEICRTSANFMLRGSSFHAYTCDVCAEICIVCADECAPFSADEQMQACADICRRCADSCEAMVEEME